MTVCCSVVQVSRWEGRVFWYLPSAAVQGPRVEKPPEVWRAHIRSSSVKDARWGGCWTEAAQLLHCSLQLDNTAWRFQQAGCGCAASAVLAASWKQLHLKCLEPQMFLWPSISNLDMVQNKSSVCSRWVLCTQVVKFGLGTSLYFLKQSSNLKFVIFYYSCSLVCF